MKLATSSGTPLPPEYASGTGTLKPRPSGWRAACASLAVAGLTLFTTSARAVNWIDADLGGPTLAGSTVVNPDGSWTITGGGADIWNNTSNFHYRYAWASGQTWDMVCQVTSFAGPDAWSKVELLVDNANLTTGPQGSDAFIAVMGTQPSTSTPAGVNQFGNDQYRTVANGAADWSQVGTTPTPQYPNAWMKIHRNGAVFQLYYSYDGVNWTNYINLDTSSSAPLGGGSSSAFPGTAWPDTVAVGIGVTAHNDSDPGGAVATIANVSSTFSSITPPTVLNPTVQVSNVTATVGSEASFSFVTTNNSVPNVVQPTYQWYKNGVLNTNWTGQSITWLATAADNGAQFYCKATVPPPYNTTVSSVTSATGTLTVNPGVILTNGLKREFFANTTSRTAVEAGNVGPATSINVRPNFDDAGGYGNNYIQRLSGWFIPPTSDNYVFFVASDDDSDVFLSTDSNPANKAMIAQEVGYSEFDQWLNPGGNGSTASQKRSDQFSPDGGNTTPWAAGIPLVAGHLYYIEGVMHQGGGADDFSVTYQTVSQVNNPNWGVGGGVFDNGTNSIITTANANIAFISYPDSTPTWTLQPTNITVTAGTGGGFTVAAVDGGEFAPNYQWYSNSVPVVGATSASLYYGSMPASANGAQFYAVATGVMNGLSSTSAVVTVNVASPVLERGWTKVEWWFGSGLAALEAGTLGLPQYVITSPKFEADSTGSSGNNYANRLSTLFYPPTSGYYVFFINSDDQSDLFVSTDSTVGNKRKVASEGGWSNAWDWTGAGGGGSVATQKRSDQWSPDGGTTTPYQNGILLNAGQPYYIEMDHQDTGGGENAEATFKLVEDPDPAVGSASRLTGSLIAINVPRSFGVNFTQQPTNVTVGLNGVATFTVGASTDSQVAVGTTGNVRSLWNNTIAYQWYKNGVAIPGATGSSYSFGPVSPLDTGAQFSCQIRSLGYVDNSGADKWLTSASASVTVSGAAVYETGYALHRYWGSNPGRTSVENNTAGTPDWIESTPAFEADIYGTEVADNFCDDLIGFITPTVSGNYVFFLNSDDDADLLLSPDSSLSDAVIIAQQTSYGGGALKWSSTANGVASQVRSDTFIDPNSGTAIYASGIPLVAGRKYAARIVHHQGGGGTYSSVTAKLVTDPDPLDGDLSTIRGAELGTYVPPCSYVNITNQPQSLTVNNYGSAAFSVTAGTDSQVPIGPEGDWRNTRNNFLAYQWYKNGVPVSGATGPTFSIPVVLPSDEGDQIYVTTRALGYHDASNNALWATSSVANLTVNVVAPQVTYAGYYVNTNNVGFGNGTTNYITVAFSAPMDPVALANPSTYTLGGGLTLLSILVNTNDYRSVNLAVAGTITYPVNVSVASTLSAQGGGLPVANTTVAVNPTGLQDTDIGTPGTDPAVPGQLYIEGTGAYTVTAEGSDIWGNADGFNFAYEMKTNDFDVVVRQKDIKHTSNWAKGGLMVRENLSAGSRNWNIINDPSSADGIPAPDGSGYGANAVECNVRNTTGGTSGGWDFNPRPAPTYPNAWVRLKRTGGLLQAFVSTNGTSWTLQATNTPALVGDATPLPSVVYVGLCTTAHNNDVVGTDPTQLLYLNTVDYDNYNSNYTPVTVEPVLQATVSGGNITVTWTPATGRLLASPALTGASWTQVGTGGSVTLPITGGSWFFKVVTP